MGGIISNFRKKVHSIINSRNLTPFIQIKIKRFRYFYNLWESPIHTFIRYLMSVQIWITWQRSPIWLSWRLNIASSYILIRTKLDIVTKIIKFGWQKETTKIKTTESKILKFPQAIWIIKEFQHLELQASRSSILNLTENRFVFERS